GGSLLRRCGGARFLILWGWLRGRGSGTRPRECRSWRPPVTYSARRFPEPAGNLNRVNACLLPPRTLVTRAMHRAVMSAAERDRKLIADLAAERAGLGKSKMVGVRGLAAAHETRLLGDIAQVFPVAIAPRRSEREDALVDALRLTSVGAFGGGNR